VKETADAILKADQAAYLEAIEAPRDPLLAEMERFARERGEPISDPEVASFLSVTARAAAPRNVVEVGTNIGYGAIVLARAAGPNARVVTIEHDPEMVTVARAFIERAGLAAQIEVRQGEALRELRRIAAAEEEIDLAYIDCVKEEYPEYLDVLLPKLGPRGVLIADNVLWKGFVAANDVPAREAKRVEALRTFNRRIMSEPSLRGAILPLGDGVAYAARIT